MTTEPLLHTMAEAAKILGMSVKTLLNHVQHGRIRFIEVGTGKQRKRRKFTDQNIATFIAKQKVREVVPCPSTKAPKAHSTPTTSKSTVVAFSALQKPGPKKKPKP